MKDAQHFRLLRVLPPPWVLAFSILFASAQPGSAIDHVNFHIIGFSKNARWFAFTEFVIGDASGVPHVRTFILDTKRNRWAPGTPIRVEKEEATLFAAHDQSQKLAAKKLREFEVRYPGRILVVNPLAESTSNPGEVIFKPHRSAPEITLTVGNFPASTVADCRGDTPVALLLTGKIDGKKPLELYRDKSKQLSKLRRCATNYSIAAVYGAPDPTSSLAVVLIYIHSPGWEGGDVYLTAVPVILPSPS